MPMGQPGCGEVAVVVPLQVGNGVRRQQCADLVEQVVGHLGPCDVQHQLVACGEQWPTLQLQCPVRVRAEQVAVGVDHLRLYPQAELHTQAVDVGDELAQAMGEFRLVGPPVTQGRAVVVAAVEPAVVQHEAFNAQCRRGCGQFLHGAGVDVEVEAFPGVQVHRPRLHGAAVPVQAAAQFGVKVGGQPVKALGGARGHQFRRVQRGARGQQAFARRQPLAQLPLEARIVQPLDGLLVVAGPGQVRAVDQTGVVGGAWRSDHGPGEAIVGRAAAPAFTPP